MKVISAFAGLGGAELALKRAGIQADIYAERDFILHAAETFM